MGKVLAESYADFNPIVWDREELDITNEEELRAKLQEMKPDLVYNCAAYNLVDKAEEEVEQADTLNGYAVGNLARVCNDIDAVLVHFSTNYVFDGENSEGYSEGDKPKPISAYGRSKRLGEIELEQNTDKYYLIRTAWLYGGKGTGKRSFIDLMLELSKNDKAIDAVTDEFGQPTFVHDLVQALVLLIQEQKPFGTYHLTNSGIASWYDWAKEIFSIKNIAARLSQVNSLDLKRMAKRPKYAVLNNTKFIELRPWTEALREYLNGKS